VCPLCARLRNYNNGWQETRTLPNAVLTQYAYNPVGALTSLETNFDDNGLSTFTSFTYDGVFNITGFTGWYGTATGLPNGARTFGYDTKDRLTASSIPTSSSSTTSSSYGFDYAGNRTGVNSTTIPFNSDNQNSSTGYSFDGNGNPTDYNGTSLSFDPENRVSAIGSTSTATYRADGLRASKTVGSTTTYYLYHGGEPIVELNSSGTVTAFNIFAPDGLVARTAGSTTTEYVFDQQGNVADRTNTSGAVQSVTQYDG
jgi:YD repeat-containing protein